MKPLTSFLLCLLTSTLSAQTPAPKTDAQTDALKGPVKKVQSKYHEVIGERDNHQTITHTTLTQYNTAGNHTLKQVYRDDTLRQNLSWEYNALGQRTAFHEANGPWVSHTTYAYNANGDETELSWIQGTRTFKFVQTYDDHHHLLTFTEYVNGEKTGTMTDTYDAKGRVVKSVEQKQGETETTDLYTYDDASRPLTHRQLDSAGRLVREWTTVYDAKGNKTEWLLTSYEQQEPWTEKNVYAYNAQNQLAEETNYVNGKITGRISRAYGPHGITLQTHYAADSSTISKRTYTYDDKGRLVDEQATGRAYPYESRDVYAYDAYGNWVKHTETRNHKVRTTRREIEYY